MAKATKPKIFKIKKTAADRRSLGWKHLMWAALVIFILAFGALGTRLLFFGHADPAPQVPKSFSDASKLTINGSLYHVQTPGKPWSNLIGSNIDRFEVRDGDLWTNATHTKPTARSELSGLNFVPFNDDVWLSFAMYLPSSSALPTGVNWLVAGQFHASDDPDEHSTSPPFAQYFNGGVFQVETRSNTAATNNGVNVPGQVQYQDANFPRNTWVHFVYHLKFSRQGGGFLQGWRDGQEIIPAERVPMGYNNIQGMYWKFGVYRSLKSQGTTIMRYANMEEVIGLHSSLASRVTNPLPIVGDSTN